MTAEASVGAVGRLRGRMRGALGGLSAPVPTRDRRPLFGYAAYTLGMFVIFLIATFPHDLLLKRALQGATARSPFAIETGTGSLGWTLGYAIDSLRIRTRDPEGEPLLLAEALLVAPSRLGLLWGNPYPVGVGASLYGGTLRATVDPRPASFRVDATLEGVDLSRYTGARPWLDGSLRGRVDGALALDGAGRGPSAATGTVTLRIPGLTLERAKVRGITVPDLHFTDVHLTGVVKSGRLEISELVAEGQELGVRGEGNVLLREPLETSVLGLDLVITPAAGVPEGLKLAVGLLPGTNREGGARRISVGGTLGRPILR